MSFWKSVTNFLSNPIVRGVSAVTGAAGAGGLFDGTSWGDTVTKIAGAANIATGAASALDSKQSGLSRALGGLQIGLGGFNVLQGGVDLPGVGKVGGFGSINSMLSDGGPSTSPLSGVVPGSSSGGSVSGSGWANLDDESRLIFESPLAPPPGSAGTTSPGYNVYGYGGGTTANPVPLMQGVELPTGTGAAPPSTAGVPRIGSQVAALPQPPALAPRPTAFGNGQLVDFETLDRSFPIQSTATARDVVAGSASPVMAPTSGGYVTGGAANMGAPALPPPAAPPASAPTQTTYHTPTGTRVLQPDGSWKFTPDKAAGTFFQRLADGAMNDPFKAMASTAAVSGMLASMFQPSVADIYKDMQAKYDPDSANAQQFRAEFRARAERDARKQHAQLSAQMRATMADRGMADSSVAASAQAELDKGLTEIIANLDWNAWQAWNQYARGMGLSSAQNAQAASMVAGQPQNFSNVGRMLARA